MIRVLTVDDNDVIRSGLNALLSVISGMEVVGEAATGREAIARVQELAPDVVLLDVRMPVLDGVQAVKTLADTAGVIMLTYSDEPSVVAAALSNGASGFLVHGRFDRDELAAAIRDVAAGRHAVSTTVIPALLTALRDAERTEDPAAAFHRSGHGLTPREAEVMDLIARGRSNADIAEELVLAEKTVKNTINRIYMKLAVQSRGEAMALWLGSDGATQQ